MSTIPEPRVRSHGELRGLLAALSITGRMVKCEAECSDTLVSLVLHGHRQSERVADALTRLIQHPEWSQEDRCDVAAQIRELTSREGPDTKTPAAPRAPKQRGTGGRPAEPSAYDGAQCQPGTPSPRLTRRAADEVSAAAEATR